MRNAIARTHAKEGLTMQINPKVSFFTQEDVNALRSFASLVERLPRDNFELRDIVIDTVHLSRWLWSRPRLIRCSDIADKGRVWPPLEVDLKRVVSKIVEVGDQLQPLGFELLAEFEQALDSEGGAQEVRAGAAKRLAMLTAYVKRSAVLAKGIRGQVDDFTYQLRTMALPSLRKLRIASTADVEDNQPLPSVPLTTFWELVHQLLQGDRVGAGASALSDVCALLHDYIKTAIERLEAFEDKAELLEFILCLEEVLNLWREVRQQAHLMLEALA